jgi:nucleoporin p58/p45
MFAQQPTSALNITTATTTTNAPPAAPAGQMGQTGTQPSLFSGFGQQQGQPTQSLFGNLQTQQQQQQQQQQSLLQQQLTQPSVNQGGGAPGLFGSSTWRPGASTTPTQQLGAQSGQPLFTKSMKFNDLPDNVKKTFEDIEYVRCYCHNGAAIQLFLEHISRGESRSARISSNVKSVKKQQRVKI